MSKIQIDQLDPILQAAIQRVTARRARRVLDHILEHGHVSTDDLKQMGYDHPPRAARDVRECGVPLVTTRISSTSGRSIAVYTLGNPADVEHHKLEGRQVLPKALREALFASQRGRCAVCHHAYEARYLQVDHRIPYEVAGEASQVDEIDSFMLLCASCQRRKSWSCEGCPNWHKRERNVCESCFWAKPVGYQHVALEDVRVLTLTFSGPDAQMFDRAQRLNSEDDLVATAREAVLALGYKE